MISPKALFSVALLGATASVSADSGFIVMGDSGTGQVSQYRVAASMAQTCSQVSCDFVLGLGDNIYEYGPKSVTDVQFKTKFEDPYKDFDIPFFMVQGNHDNSLIVPGDGGFNQRGFREVEYTQHSPRWRMPSRYYSFEADQQNALFIAVDSNPQNAYLPPLFSPYWWPNGKYVKQQTSWIQNVLSDSSAQWKFAFAHHPYMTNGHHGNDVLLQGNKPYRQFVQKALCDDVDFFFAGHEHALELLSAQQDDDGKCGTTFQAISGAAAKNNGKREKSPEFQTIWDSYDQQWGYFHGLISGDQFTLTAYTVNEAGDTTQAFQKVFNK